jgi:hypothetical protein
MTIVELTDDDFAAMLRGEVSVRAGLTQPPGGVDQPEVLRHVRRLASNLRCNGFSGGHWMMVVSDEVVGLCGFKAPPSSAGEIELGYGVAESRRGRGHAEEKIGQSTGKLAQPKSAPVRICSRRSIPLTTSLSLTEGAEVWCGDRSLVVHQALGFDAVLVEDPQTAKSSVGSRQAPSGDRRSR